jgi:RNA recognition motif-containing protein
MIAGDVKNVEMLMDMGRPSGDALVRFGTEEDALRAVSILSQQGRFIAIVCTHE